MPSCEGCNWRIQYDMKLTDLESLIASFPPRHGDSGLIYDREEVATWLLKAKTIVQKEKDRKPNYR